MALHTIKNKYLSASVNSLGAELSSLKTSQDELLWQADKSVWPRHAPVLFPIVGKLKNDNYRFKEQEYKLSQHGFARDQEFVLIHQDERSLEFELTATEETLRVYPFRLSVSFFIDHSL
jgi:galactose mutarotase-like enzyme